MVFPTPSPASRTDSCLQRPVERLQRPVIIGIAGLAFRAFRERDVRTGVNHPPRELDARRGR